MVLAAGKGSRFGGDKQWTPVDEMGHCLAEYALYDARLCGVERVVFVIRNEDLARWQRVRQRIAGHLCVSYVIQPDPAQYGFAPEHPPLGTGHALLCGLQAVKEPFVLFNADDYYGKEAVAQAVRCAFDGDCGLVAYPLGDTVPTEGSVHRALCHRLSDGGVGLCECTVWRDAAGRLFARDATCTRLVEQETLVGMNLLALQPDLMGAAVRCFTRFLTEGTHAECLLSEVLNEHCERTHMPLRLLLSADRWMGMTYRTDMGAVRRHLQALRRSGEYPARLWQ